MLCVKANQIKIPVTKTNIDLPSNRPTASRISKEKIKGIYMFSYRNAYRLLYIHGEGIVLRIIKKFRSQQQFT